MKKPKPGPGRPRSWRGPPAFRGMRAARPPLIVSQAKRIVEDPEYLQALRERMIDGRCPHMEVLLFHYAYGRPGAMHDPREGESKHRHKFTITIGTPMAALHTARTQGFSLTVEDRPGEPELEGDDQAVELDGETLGPAREASPPALPPAHREIPRERLLQSQSPRVLAKAQPGNTREELFEPEPHKRHRAIQADAKRRAWATRRLNAARQTAPDAPET